MRFFIFPTSPSPHRSISPPLKRGRSLLAIVLFSLYSQPLLAAPAKRIACPSDLPTLTTLLVRDLPSYANRVNQSARRRSREFDLYSYFLIAGQAELEPLTLGPGQYVPADPAIASPEQPQQVFITTLERQYIDSKIVRWQQYHWLFLVQTPSGWHLATIFSSIGSYPNSPNSPPSPPRESSNSIVGQAVNMWLRDCRANDIQEFTSPAASLPP